MTHARPNAHCCKILILSQETKSLKTVDVHSLQGLSRCPDKRAECFLLPSWTPGGKESRREGGEPGSTNRMPFVCGRGDTWLVCDDRKGNKSIDINPPGLAGRGWGNDYPDLCRLWFLTTGQTLKSQNTRWTSPEVSPRGYSRREVVREWMWRSKMSLSSMLFNIC